MGKNVCVHMERENSQLQGRSSCSAFTFADDTMGSYCTAPDALHDHDTPPYEVKVKKSM